jgi:hypothetical protein
MMLADGMDYSTRTQTASQRVRAQYATVPMADYVIMRNGFEAMQADRNLAVSRLKASVQAREQADATIAALQAVLTRNAHDDARMAHRRAVVALTLCGAMFVSIAWLGVIGPAIGW